MTYVGWLPRLPGPKLLKIQMNKRAGLTWFKYLGFKTPTKIKSTTLIELLISLIVMSVMVLSFYGLQTYGREQIRSADRRAKVQNSLVYSIEHMSKYVQQASGNKNNPAIELYPAAGASTGFQVHLPDATGFDNCWVYYTLAGNKLSTGFTGTCGSIVAEDLTGNNRICSNFNNSAMPASPADGFYVRIDPLGAFVEIGLVGRYDTAAPYTWETRSINPQVAMKTKVVCNNFSTH